MHEIILGFLVVLFVLVTLYWTLIPRRWRNAYLLLLSFCGVVLLDVTYAGYFLLNIVLLYWVGEHIRNKHPHRRLIFQVALGWLVLNLLFFKYINQLLLLTDGHVKIASDGLNVPAIVFPIGISYLSFRLIHYLVESYRACLPRTSFQIFALYTFFLPTFLSGPVERFQNFHPQAQQPSRLRSGDIVAGLYRILVGLFRKFIIADYTAGLIMPVLENSQKHSAPLILICIYGLIFWIYMDLAGYTDMAIGTSRLFGFTIMENFNRPLIQKNIGLYWRNWHISVYTWIRDYIFFPLFGLRSSPIMVYLGSFLIVFLFMVWHAGTLGYVAAGIYHGCGIVSWQLFRAFTRRRPGLRNLFEKQVFKFIFIGLTYNFISFGVLLYTFSYDQIKSILNTVFFSWY